MQMDVHVRVAVIQVAAFVARLVVASGPGHGQGVPSKPDAAGGGPSGLPSAPAVDVWLPVGHIEHQPVRECSGIVASRQYAGIFWVHNDSGHAAVLYAVKESGELVAEVPVEGATNADWEDIAADEDGQLYVGGWNAVAGESNWTETFLATAAPTDGEWHHVALTLEGGATVSTDALKAYLDGASIGSGDGSQLWDHGGDIGFGNMNEGTLFHDGGAVGSPVPR